MGNTAASKLISILNPLRYGVWIIGISSWLFGIADRSIAAFSDGRLNAIDLVQLLTASFLACGWFLLKPNRK